LVDLSIIIVSWNTRQHLRRCLQSLGQALALHNHPVEILVIDNASGDGSPVMIEHEFGMVELIRNHQNFGFARANNQGLALARGRYLVLLNPDTEIRPTALSELLSFMESDPTAGAAGPKLLNPDGSLQISCYPAPTVGRELWRMFHLDRLHPLAAYPPSWWQSSRPLTVDMAQGACLMLRREALRRVGMLDERFFMYTEEVDLCLRLRKAGWGIHWVPSAEVTHYGGQSTGQSSEVMFLELYKSKILFFRKHYGGAATAIYKGILTAASLARLAWSAVAALADRSKNARSAALAGNYLRLIRALPGL
jgi:GT2 family glycosyltransferase